MTNTAFYGLLKPVTVKGRLSKQLANALPDETKKAITEHIVRKRGPIVMELIPSGVTFDQWLSCMGYFYITTGAKSGYKFRHTCEHTIV
jgi:hypothetical protein